jgi:hypothetical protein
MDGRTREENQKRPAEEHRQFEKAASRVRCSATSIDRESKATGAGAARLLSAWWREGVSRILSPSAK